MSDSLWPHGLHARLLCPSPAPGTCSDSCPSSRWCHPTIILCCPLLLLPSIFPSIKVFSSESALCTRWPTFWNFSFSISPSNEYSGLISFRIDWFDLAVQGTLKDLLQHHNLKASILQCSALFLIQIPVLYMTTGKTSTVHRVTNSPTLLSNWAYRRHSGMGIWSISSEWESMSLRTYKAVTSMRMWVWNCCDHFITPNPKLMEGHCWNIMKKPPRKAEWHSGEAKSLVTLYELLHQALLRASFSSGL